MEAQTRELTEQLDTLVAEVTQSEEAVKDASNRVQQANTDFSNLMAAMSAAFREYDQVKNGR